MTPPMAALSLRVLMCKVLLFERKDALREFTLPVLVPAAILYASVVAAQRGQLCSPLHQGSQDDWGPTYQDWARADADVLGMVLVCVFDSGAFSHTSSQVTRREKRGAGWGSCV